MAKETSVELDDFDFDDELNFDIDTSTTDEEEDSDSRKPVKKAFKQTLAGAKERIAAPEFITKLIKESLPEEYTDAPYGLDGSVYDQTTNLARTATELYHDAVATVKPEANRIYNQLYKLVPDNQRKVKGFLDKLKDIAGFGGEENDYSYSSSTNYDEQRMQSDLKRIFEVQMDQQAQMRVEDQSENLIQTTIENQRHQQETQQLQNIQTSLGRLVGYNDRINSAYQKKSLELQYRSYFVQTGMAKKISEYFEIFKKQGDAIVKNTFLPDFVKQKDSERFKELSRSKFFDKLQSGLFGQGSGIERAIEKIKKKVKSNVSDLASGLSQGTSMLSTAASMRENMASMGGGGDDRSLAEQAKEFGITEGGKWAGGMAANSLGDRIAKQINEKLIGRNERVRNAFMQVGKYATDIPASMRELARSDLLKETDAERLNGEISSYRDVGNLGNVLSKSVKSGLKGMLGLFDDEVDTSLGITEGIGSLQDPAVFDTITKRSIDNIIPGYLARILREVQVFRTGDDTIALTEFDHSSNSFMDRGKIRRSLAMVNQVKKTMKEAIAGNSVTNAIKSVEQELDIGNMSPDAQKAIRKVIVDTISDPKAGMINSSTLMNPTLYEHLDPTVAAEIQDGLKKRYDREDGSFQTKDYVLNQKTMLARKSLQAPQGHIESMIKLGNMDIVQDMGLVTKGTDVSAFNGIIEKLPKAYIEPIKTAASQMKKGDSINDLLSDEVKEKIKKDDKNKIKITRVLKTIDGMVNSNNTRVSLSMAGYRDFLLQQLNTDSHDDDGDDHSPDDTPRSPIDQGPTTGTTPPTAPSPSASPSPSISPPIISTSAASTPTTPPTSPSSPSIPTRRGVKLYLPPRFGSRVPPIAAGTSRPRTPGANAASNTSQPVATVAANNPTPRTVTQTTIDSKGVDRLVSVITPVNSTLLEIRDLLKQGVSKIGGMPTITSGIATTANTATTDAMSASVAAEPITTAPSASPSPSVSPPTTKKGSLAERVLKQAAEIARQPESVMKFALDDATRSQFQQLPGDIRRQIEAAYDKLTPGKSLTDFMPEEAKGRIDALPADVKIKVETTIRRIQQVKYPNTPVAGFIGNIELFKNIPNGIKNAVHQTAALFKNKLSGGEETASIDENVVSTPPVDAEVETAAPKKSYREKLSGLFKDILPDKLSAPMFTTIGMADTESSTPTTKPSMAASAAESNQPESSDAEQSLFKAWRDKLAFDKLKELKPDIKPPKLNWPKGIKPDTAVDPQTAPEIAPTPPVQESKKLKAIKAILKTTRGIDKGYRNVAGKALMKAPGFALKTLGNTYKYGGKALLGLGGLGGMFIAEGIKGHLGIGNSPAPMMTTVPQQQTAPEPSSTTTGNVKDSIWNRAVKKMTTVPQQQAAPEPSSTQAAESVDNAQATASKAKDSIWNRAVKKMADTVGKGKEMPTGTVTDVLKRLTTEKALKEDNQDPAQTQRHLSQLQTLEFINTIFRKKKSAETEAESPDGEKKTAFNDTDKSGERDGSWKDRIKASMRRGFKGEMPKEAEVKYKSDKNVIDLMAEKAKEVMDKLKGNAESVKEGLEDAAEDLLDNDGPDGRKKGKGKVKSNKPLSKKDRLRKGIRSVLDKTRAVDKGYRRLVGKAVRKGASLGARAYGTVYKAGGNALWNVGKSAVLGGLEGAGGLIMKGVTAARGMAMAGSAIGAAGGVGGLLAAAGSMMLTPVGLIAGVGALGYGAYKAFKWWNRNKASVYTNLRLRQYGLTESDSDNNHFIFELEEYLMKEAVGYQHEGTPYLMEKKLDPEKVLEIFDIDAEDEERMEGFMTWFNGRFKPVFLSHLAALFKVDRKANLHDIDDIKPEALVQYINTIATSNGPYDITASPFEDPEELSAGPNDVEAAIDLAKLELSKISKNLKGKEALPGVAAVSQTTQALDKKTEAEHTARPSTSIGKAVEATKPESKGIVQNILGKIPSLLLEAGTAVSDMFDDAKKLMTKFSKNLIHKFAGFATALEAVRFKTYGLVTIDIHKAGIFRKLEKGLFKYLTVDKDVKASFEGDVTEILKEYGSDFGVTGIEHENAPTWIRWFRLRFLPAYLDYIGAATQALGKREPDEIEDILKENDKYNIALKLSGLSDVWRVEEAPWPNTKSGLDPKVCDENLNYLQARVKEEQIKEEKAKKPADSQTNAGIKPPEQKPYSMTEDARRTNENLQQRTDGENPSILKQQTNDGGPDTETKQTLGNLHVTMDQGPMASGLGGDAFLNVAPGVDVGHIHPGLLQNLKAMAEDYGTQTGKKLHITSGFRSREKQEMLHRKDPKMTAAPGHSLHEFGLALDASSKDLNELESLGLMRKYGFTRPVGGEDWHMEPAGIQTNIQKAKDDFNFAEKMIQASIGHGGGGYGTVGNAAKARRNSQLALSLLGDINTTPPDMVATAEKMKDLRANPTNAAPPMEGAQSGGYGDQGGQATGYTGGVGGGQAAGGGYGGMTPVGYGGGSQGGGLTLQTKSFGAMGGGGYAGSVASSGSSATSGGGQGWMNQTATGQDGEKPSASQPPLKTTPPGKQEILKIIEEGSKEVGVDPQTMKVFAAQESSLNPNAGARNTSAKGLFQFLSSTWQEQLRKFDKKYDELAAGSSPYDPKASTILAGEYLKQNFNQIKNLVPKLGPVEAYMTHLLGGGGAKRFFSTPPETPAAAVLPKAAGSNRSLFFAGGSPLSISGVYENIKNMLAKKAASFGIPMPDSTNVGQGSAPPDAVAGADDPSKGLSMTVEKKPSDQIAGYINGKAVPSQAAGSAATPSEPLTSPAASTTTATNESNQGSGQGTQVSTPPAAKKDDGMTRVDLSRKLTDNPPEPSTPPPTPLTASESSPTQQLGQAPAGYSASVSTPTQQYASQATALNPNTTANAALPGLVPMQDKRDLIAPAAMVMQANAPLVPSFNMATLGDGINSVGDTLKSSLKIQQETLDVLKTLASSLSPEQMQSLLKGLAPTPAPDTAPAPSSPSAPMTSAKRDIPASAINLNRTMA